MNPTVYLADVQSLMVANYEAGVARQERADADALATERAGAVPVVSAPQNTGSTPVAVPAASPAPAPGCALEALIRSVFIEDPDWAVMIAKRESHCDSCAFNPGQSDCGAQPTSAKGVFQLLGHASAYLDAGCSEAQWADPVCGVNAAHVLYLGSGRSPWNF